MFYVASDCVFVLISDLGRENEIKNYFSKDCAPHNVLVVFGAELDRFYGAMVSQRRRFALDSRHRASVGIAKEKLELVRKGNVDEFIPSKKRQ